MPKLSYFDLAGSRGEECRLALHLAGVAFEDDRIKDWPARKEQTPWGTVPTFEVEGRGVLGQSSAILLYIGREHRLHPSDPWQAALHEDLMGAVEDLRATARPLLHISDPEQRVKARQDFAAGYLKRWGQAAERRLTELGAGPFAAGADIHVVDLKLYMIVRWFANGTVDHVPRDVFAEFPRLTGVYQAVAEHPKVVAWYAR